MTYRQQRDSRLICTSRYLPSHKASLPLDQYLITLLDDRGTCDQLAKVESGLAKRWRPGYEPMTFKSNALTITPPGPMLIPQNNDSVTHHYRWVNETFLTYFTTPHNRFTALFPGLPGWAGARIELLDFMVQGKTNRCRHADHTAGHHSIQTNHSNHLHHPPLLLQTGCPSCHQTNSVKALNDHLIVY